MSLRNILTAHSSSGRSASFNVCGFVAEGTMELDSKRNKKTMLNEHGQYPVWMSQRQAKKMKTKRTTKKTGQAKKKKGIAW